MLELLAERRMPTLGSVRDIAPTVLAMMHIPIGGDMHGRVLDDLLTDEFSADHRPPTVATHDTPEFLASRPKGEQREGDEQERLEQLRSLGYLGDVDEDESDDGKP